MKIKQNFIYSNHDGIGEKKDNDTRCISYNMMKYQQIKWIFSEYGISIIESSVHWTLIFFNIYLNGDKFIEYSMNILDNKNVEIIVNIKNVRSIETEPIVLTLFSYYIQNNKIDIESQGPLCISSSDALTTYRWNDIHVDLVENKVVDDKRYRSRKDILKYLNNNSSVTSIYILKPYIDHVTKNLVSVLKDVCVE